MVKHCVVSVLGRGSWVWEGKATPVVDARRAWAGLGIGGRD
jgi:hypothetical protein